MHKSRKIDHSLRKQAALKAKVRTKHFSEGAPMTNNKGLTREIIVQTLALAQEKYYQAVNWFKEIMSQIDKKEIERLIRTS